MEVAHAPTRADCEFAMRVLTCGLPSSSWPDRSVGPRWEIREWRVGPQAVTASGRQIREKTSLALRVGRRSLTGADASRGANGVVWRPGHPSKRVSKRPTILCLKPWALKRTARSSPIPPHPAAVAATLSHEGRGQEDGSRVVDCWRSMLSYDEAIIISPTSGSDGSAMTHAKLGVEFRRDVCDARRTCARSSGVAGIHSASAVECGDCAVSDHVLVATSLSQLGVRPCEGALDSQHAPWSAVRRAWNTWKVDHFSALSPAPTTFINPLRRRLR